LDQPQSQLGSNMLVNASNPHGPFGRLTGVVLVIELACFNRINLPSELDVGEWKGNVCSVQVKPQPPSWNMEQFATTMGQTRHMTVAGVSVNLRGKGSVRVLSLSKLLAWAVDAYVLMQIPVRLCRFLALYFLGHMSLIYRNVCQGRFNLSRHVAKLAMQLMTSTTAFQQIANVKGSFSLPDMAARMAWLTDEFKELDDTKVRNFAAVAFMVALGTPGHVKYRKKAIGEAMSKFLWPQESSCIGLDLVRRSKVGLKEFMLASFSSSHLDLDLLQLVRLLDKDRPIRPLERLFLPKFVRRRILPTDEDQLNDLFQPTEAFDVNAPSGSKSLSTVIGKKSGVVSHCSQHIGMHDMGEQNEQITSVKKLLCEHQEKIEAEIKKLQSTLDFRLHALEDLVIKASLVDPLSRTVTTGSHRSNQNLPDKDEFDQFGREIVCTPKDNDVAVRTLPGDHLRRQADDSISHGAPSVDLEGAPHEDAPRDLRAESCTLQDDQAFAELKLEVQNLRKTIDELAYASWRTIHELDVQSCKIAKHDTTLSGLMEKQLSNCADDHQRLCSEVPRKIENTPQECFGIQQASCDKEVSEKRAFLARGTPSASTLRIIDPKGQLPVCSRARANSRDKAKENSDCSEHRRKQTTTSKTGMT